MTWDEMVEVAAKAAIEGLHPKVRWGAVNDATRSLWRGYADASLRALCAAGVVMVPKDCTDEIAEGIANMANCCGGIAESTWRAALSAGEIKPEGE